VPCDYPTPVLILKTPPLYESPSPPQRSRTISQSSLAMESIGRDVEVRMQNAIAEAEGLDYASRQAAASFYCGGSSQSLKRDITNVRWKDTNTTLKEDAHLMLFRDPPPWCVLEDIKRDTNDKNQNAKHRGQEDKAVLDRDGVKGKTGINGLMEMINRRKVVSQMTSTSQIGPEPTITSKPRNPFVRNLASDRSSKKVLSSRSVDTPSSSPQKRDVVKKREPLLSGVRVACTSKTKDPSFRRGQLQIGNAEGKRTKG
jgi:hypothetical protein